MKVLLTYATYTGSTENASQIVSSQLTAHGIAFDYFNIADLTFKQLTEYDLIIICTPTFEVQGKDGQPHEDFLNITVSKDFARLNGKKFAVLGLGDSSYVNFCGSVDILEKALTSIKGVLVIPSLKIDGFLYHQSEHTATIKSWADNLAQVIISGYT
jgi:flavodoxin